MGIDEKEFLHADIITSDRVELLGYNDSVALDKFRSFFKRRERFLVVEIIGKLVRMSSFLVDFSDKNIQFLKTEKISLDHSKSGAPLTELKALGKIFGKLSRYRVILSLGSKLATTIHSSVTLMRDKPKEPIDDSDLDNRIAQGIWKLFDRERGRAAAKMEVHDLEVMLTDIRVKRVKLDGHRVVNPVGFKAKTVEINFSQTFSTRRFIEDIRRFIPASHICLMAEGGTMASDMLARGGASHFIFAALSDIDSDLFFSSGSGVGWIRTVPWGRKSLLLALEEAFAVSEEVAEKILGLYLIRQASPAVLRRIERLLSDACTPFAESLREAISEYEANEIYLFSFFSLPELMFLVPVVKRLLKERVRVLPVGEEFLNDQLGFAISSVPRGSATLLHAVSGILEFYFLPHDDKMNRIAKRHARWLIS